MGPSFFFFFSNIIYLQQTTCNAAHSLSNQDSFAVADVIAPSVQGLRTTFTHVSVWRRSTVKIKLIPGYAGSKQASASQHGRRWSGCSRVGGTLAASWLSKPQIDHT